MPNILRLPATKAKTGISATSTLYLLVSQGQFPRPVKLGQRATGWVEAEIDDWIAARVAERDAVSEGTALA